MSSQPHAKSETAKTDALTASEETTRLTQRHFRWGWWCLLLFMVLGVALESLNAFKVGDYLNLNVDNETRRLMWKLAHALRALLALVHLAFAAMATLSGSPQTRSRYWASRCLTVSAILIPLGFFLSRVEIHRGDPGLGVLLVPIGVALLLAAIAMTASSLRRSS